MRAEETKSNERGDGEGMAVGQVRWNKEVRVREGRFFGWTGETRTSYTSGLVPNAREKDRG